MIITRLQGNKLLKKNEKQNSAVLINQIHEKNFVGTIPDCTTHIYCRPNKSISNVLNYFFKAKNIFLSCYTVMLPYCGKYAPVVLELFFDLIHIHWIIS